MGGGAEEKQGEAAEPRKESREKGQSERAKRGGDERQGVGGGSCGAADTVRLVSRKRERIKPSVEFSCERWQAATEV